MMERILPTCKDGPIKRITNAEFQAKKEKGLCFGRDEIFSLAIDARIKN